MQSTGEAASTKANVQDPPYSDEFKAEDAEVTYESSDGTRFRIHGIYLKVHTEVLSPPVETTLDEVVRLSEPAVILEILFRFIYPIRQPDLETMDFELVEQLAEAAEKYQVFPAMYACFLQMRATLPGHAAQILGYALKHDYDALVDEAAPHVLNEPSREVLKSIAPEFYDAWFTYYGHWRDVQKRALTVHMPALKSVIKGIYVRIAENLSTISQDLDLLFQFRTSPIQAPYADWKKAIQEDADHVPTLTSHLSRNKSTTDASSDMTQISGYENDVILHSPLLRPNRQGHLTFQAFHLNREIVQKCAPGLFNLLQHDSKLVVSEKPDILSLLLRFLRPVKLPDLETLPFETLLQLAQAAEKYSLFQAMYACKFRIKKILPQEVTRIFGYAGAYGYLDIMDIAAPMAIAEPSHEIVGALPSHLGVAWAQYHKRWEEICIDGASTILNPRLPFTSLSSCNCEKKYEGAHATPVLRKLVEGPQWLRKLDLLLDGDEGTCHVKKAAYLSVRTHLEERIQGVPAFSTIQ